MSVASFASKESGMTREEEVGMLPPFTINCSAFAGHASREIKQFRMARERQLLGRFYGQSWNENGACGARHPTKRAFHSQAAVNNPANVP
jgi:hypothetical protein